MAADAVADATGPDAHAERVSVVVVNHNTRDDLLRCLGTLADAGADRVVVVDSGSTDGSQAAVATAFPDVQCVALPNVGFGQAANAGIALTHSPVVVVANADTRFPPGAARVMGEHLAQRPDVGALGPMVRFPDGRLQMSARTFPSVGQALGHALLGLWVPGNRWTRAYRLTDWDHLSERDVDWVSGCCLALRREAFDDVGGFDPAYFMFVEDVDLCYRLSQRGWRVVFSPVVEVTHAIGGAVSRRRFRMVVEHARSLDRFFARRYARGPHRLLRLPIRAGLAGWVSVTIVWSLLRRRTHAHG